MHGIHRIELRSGKETVNVYVLTGAVVTLIDTGLNSEECFRQLTERLTDLRLGVGDIDRIILTHLHEDHVGLLSGLMEQSRATLYVHGQAVDSFAGTDGWKEEQERLARYMRGCFAGWGAAPAIRVWGRFYPEFLDLERIKFLREGDRIQAGDYWFDVLETPGHSRLDICLHNEEHWLLICGDVLLPDIAPTAYVEPPLAGEAARAKPLLQYMDSLAKIPCEAGTLIFPGHGEVFTDGKSWIEGRRRKVERNCARILQVLSSLETASVDTVCREVYARHYAKLPYTVLSETAGHLDVLESRGMVYMRDDGRYAVQLEKQTNR
ncbi:MBL fold metallo-hydrolase [Sporosarcina sp. P1]|uniref:MBL fold metallo-hydrolase n=1 Tax=Sporosarcina sp. P1 TaxID=2048257 RepID=UPI0013045C0B|nr:MBL fold metallo-hydrolase [Sporosarcina sp. P1]